MINREQVTLTLPKNLIAKADSNRGLIPRSRYFELAISEFLNKRKKSPSQRQPGGRSS